MKTVSLFLALVGGAGFFYRSQLGSLVGVHRQSAEGVYFLRSARTFAVPGGTVRWPAGRELHLAPLTTDAGNELTLTDGRSVSRVPRADLIRDVDDAAALRQIDEANQGNERRLVAQQPASRLTDADRGAFTHFHGSAPNAYGGWTSRSEAGYPVASAPVFYAVPQTVIVVRPAVTPEPLKTVFAPQQAAILRSPVFPQNTLPPPTPAGNRN